MFKCFGNLFLRSSEIKRLNKNIFRLEDEIDNLRSHLDLNESIVEEFFENKNNYSYQESYQKKAPLISVCVATYNRSNLLIERSLNSIIGQSYDNIEILVVGDCCIDDTEDKISAVNDSRIKYTNLVERGPYPQDPELRWMVAGTSPMNHALKIAQGDFITHLDDDDMYEPDRIEKLTRFIVETKADLVWHPFWEETRKGWRKKECLDFRKGNVTTSSVMYHNWFRKIPWDINAFRNREPGDWNRFRKFKYLGARLERYPAPLLKHFREKTQWGE
jgi:glycosyltransferase involved in cell wall biosynthesis